jgi:predicted nucleotidyltransferase
MVLNKDLREFIGLLNEKGVKYLVIGGYAVAYHGYPRYTKDIDIWIWLNEENAQKVIETIKAFGMASMHILVDDLLNPDSVIQLGMPPNRIDILTDLETLDFETCYAQKETASLDGLDIAFLDFDNLIKSKLAAGRPQDKVDAKKLRERKFKKKR